MFHKLSKKRRKALSAVIDECADYIRVNGGPDEDGFAHPECKPENGKKNGRRRIHIDTLETALELAKANGVSEELHPVHFSSIHGLYAQPKNVLEAIIRKYYSLLNGSSDGNGNGNGKFHPGQVIDLSTVENLSTNFKERVGDRECEVKFNSVFKNIYSSNVKPIAIAYLKFRREHLFLKGLKDYYFPTPPNGTYVKKVAGNAIELEVQDAAFDVVDGQIRWLIKNKYGSLNNLIKNIESSDFSAYPEELKGHTFSVRTAHPLNLVGGVFAAVCAHLQMEGLDETYQDLLPIHLARASAETLTRQMAVRMLIESANNLLANVPRFEGSFEEFCKGVKIKEDLCQPYFDHVAGDKFLVRPQKAIFKHIKTRSRALKILRGAHERGYLLTAS